MIRLYFLLASLSLPLWAQGVALSFDDGFNPVRQVHAPAWNARILDTLKHEGIQAVLFVAGNRVDNHSGLELVRQWGTSGHLIANHTYLHQNLASDKVSVNQFTADIERNERLFESMAGWTKRFRFPYLKEGKSADERDLTRIWLTDHGYKSGSVSIDASDWYYDQRFRTWISNHPDDNSDAFRDAYLAHIWSRSQYYESLAQKTLGRSVNHVLLLHTNAINAAFAGDLIHMFKRNGWQVIGIEEAFSDPLYELQPDVLPAGESILWSLAKEQGVEGLRYPAEDKIYEQPILDELGL